MRKVYLRPHRDTLGFTMIEMITIVAVVSVMAAIAAPSYVGWANNQRIKAAQDRVTNTLYHAHKEAQLRKQLRQVSFRTQDERVEFAVHTPDTDPVAWQALPEEIQIDDETSMRRSQGVYYVRFDQRGEVVDRLGRLTLSLVQNPQRKECTIISTLLGKMRRGTQGPLRNGRSCN